MSVVNKASATAVLKQMIADNPHSVATFKGNNAISLAKKVKYTGNKYHFELEYAEGDNTSFTASEALLKRNTFDKLRFEVDSVESYNAKDVSLRAMREVTDEGAFVDLLENVRETLDRAAGLETEKGVFKHHGNALGQVGASGVSSSVLTLKRRSDARKFYRGQKVRASATDGTSGTLISGEAVLTHVDFNTGKLYVAGNWTDVIPALTDDYYLFTAGSFGNGRQGLPDWIPDDAPAEGSTFNGADRALAGTRGYAHRVTANISDIAGALRKGAQYIGEDGGNGTDTALMSVGMLSSFCEQQEQKVTPVELSDSHGLKVGVNSIEWQAGGYKLNLVSSWAAPDNRIYLFPKSKLEVIHSTQGLHEIVDDDGNVLRANHDNFDFDIRTISIFNYVLRDMQASCVLKF